MRRIWKNSAQKILSIAALLSLAVFLAPTVAASSATSDVTVTLEDIIALRILDQNASSEISSLTISLTPTPSGTFTKGSFNVEGSTSNATGYKLYMTSIGKDHGESSSDSGSSSGSSTTLDGNYTTSLINTDATVETSIGTIPTLSLPTGVDSITEAAFRIANSDYRNMWGYSLAELSITDTSSIFYNPIPDHTTSTEIASVEGSTEGDLTPVTIGVNVTNAKASGTYRNTLEFTAIANAVPVEYRLTFNGNSDGNGGEEGVTNVPATMEGSSLAPSYSFTIPKTEPLLAKKGIIGWSTSPNARTGDGSGPDGLYVYGDTYTLTVDDADPYSTQKTLYAIWGDFFTITYMQEMSSTICNTVYTPSNVTGTSARAVVLRADTTSNVSGAGATSFVDNMAGYDAIATANNQPYVAQRTLYDIRDGNSYVVRKLADGNCWMTSNLKLALYDAANSTNTNPTPIAVEVVDNTTGQIVTAGTNIADGKWTPDGTGGTANAATALNGNTAYNSSNGDWYYSWYAATANSGTESMVNQDAGLSICPKGWRLPANYTVNSSKSYGVLANTYSLYNSSSFLNITEGFPLSFKRLGRYCAASLQTQNYGLFWESTASATSSAAMNLQYNSSSFDNYASVGNKWCGEPIRCVQF